MAADQRGESPLQPTRTGGTTGRIVREPDLGLFGPAIGQPVCQDSEQSADLKHGQKEDRFQPEQPALSVLAKVSEHGPVAFVDHLGSNLTGARAVPVLDPGRGQKPRLPPSIAHPIGHVDIVEEHGEALVKAVQLAEHVPTDQQAGCHRLINF